MLGRYGFVVQIILICKIAYTVTDSKTSGLHELQYLETRTKIHCSPSIVFARFRVTRAVTSIAGRGKAPSYSIELESELREKLFSSYEVMQRPHQVITVKTSLNLLSLNFLDIKEQKLSITAYFHFYWNDGRLRWILNDTYENIRFQFSNENIVWKPAIIIENSVYEIDVISKPNVPMRIYRNGKVDWMPAGIFTTHCQSTVTYWPLDSQTCDIILSSWAYTNKEVVLEFDETEIVTTFYQENGMWELINKTHDSFVTEREYERFSRLVFTLKFRRRPLFHMLNTLFPVVLMGFLTVVIFKLSPESGERVGLALTILLAYAVYLSLISESIPQTSISASLLSTYLASILFLQTLSVLLTVIYIDIYFTSADRRIPNWLRSMTSTCLSKLACADCSRKTAKISPEAAEIYHNDKIATIEDFDAVEDADKKDDSVEDDDDDEINDKELSWKDIALLLDRLTMYIYLILVTGLTGTFIAVMTYHYNTSYSFV